MPEVTQTVSSMGGGQASQASSSGVASRPIIDQTVAHGGEKSFAEGSSKPVIEQSINHADRGGMRLSEATRKMLANLDVHGTVADRPVTDSPTAAPEAGDAGAAPPAAPQPADGAAPATLAEPAKPATPSGPGQPQAAPPGAPATPAPAAPPVDEHRERADRVEARNRELVSEVERLKGTKREPTPREKALDEAERGYLDDSIGSIRRLIAQAIGTDDPKHADVDAELAGLYRDLTAKELGVTLDPAEVARRESARTRHMMARDKRERTAEQSAAQAAAQAPTDLPEAKQLAEHTQLVAGRLATKQADGKSVGDAYPLTMRLAEQLHGQKPEALILSVIRQGFATGEFDPKRQDAELVEQAAKKIEAHYQDLAKLFGGASPQPSTAAAPPPQGVTENQDTGRSQVAPTITTASASVAPATSPAIQQPAPKPKYKSEDERRRAIAQKYFKD